MASRRTASARAGPVVRALAALALATTACDAGEEATRPDRAPVPGTTADLTELARTLPTIQHGRLVACVTMTRPPYAFERDGRVDGIDAEVVRAVAGRLGLVADYRDVDKPRAFTALAEGTCDLVTGVPGTDVPSGVRLSQPYLDVQHALLVRKADEGRLRDLASAGQGRVGVVSRSAGEDLVEAGAPGAAVVRFAAFEAVVAALEAGGVGAAVVELPDAAHHALTTGGTAAHPLAGPPAARLAFAVREGDGPLREALDAALAHVRSDDTYRTILRPFLGDAVAGAAVPPP